MTTEFLEEFNSLVDFDALYRLKCQKDSVQWSGFEKGPDEEKFRAYVVTNIIENPRNHLFLLKDANTKEVMGYCQFNEEGNGVVEGRGSGLFRKFQGCGLASVLNTLSVGKAREYGMKYMYSWCSDKNTVSKIALVDAGFQKTDEKEIRHLSVFNEDHIFYKWEIHL